MKREKTKNTYEVGDKVKIINFGHVIYDENLMPIDMKPELIGQTGIVREVNITQGIPSYAIHGIKDKHAWFREEQMQLV